MKPAILTHPVHANNQVEALGLKRDLLIEVAVRMAQARMDCTKNNPPSAPGFNAWSEGTRRARELFIPLGWHPCEDGQLSSIINRELGVRLIVINADAGTGLEDSQPQNRTYKRSATDKAVAENRDFCFFEASEISNANQPPHRVRGALNWYLFVFSHRVGEQDILRAELSLPSSFHGGYFGSFHKRIMIISDEDDNGSRLAKNDEPDSGQDFEVTVTRKEA